MRCKKETVSNLIDKLNKIHNNKYIYYPDTFKGINYKIKIKCKEHCIFEQIPTNHIHNKKGCPKCCHKI